MNIRIPLATAAALACVLASGGADAKKALDATLYTGYDLNSGVTVDFVICGTLGTGQGCMGHGSFGPFEKACAVLEGIPTTKHNVMTRDIYVLDRRKSTSDLMQLFVFTRKDTFADSFETTETKFKKQVILHVAGGGDGECMLAGNNAFVYAGISGQKNLDKVDKTALTATAINGFGTLLSISSNDYGFVAVNTPGGGFVDGPDGTTVSSGGINEYLSGTHQGFHF